MSRFYFTGCASVLAIACIQHTHTKQCFASSVNTRTVLLDGSFIGNFGTSSRCILIILYPMRSGATRTSFQSFRESVCTFIYALIFLTSVRSSTVLLEFPQNREWWNPNSSSRFRIITTRSPGKLSHQAHSCCGTLLRLWQCCVIKQWIPIRCSIRHRIDYRVFLKSAPCSYLLRSQAESNIKRVICVSKHLGINQDLGARLQAGEIENGLVGVLFARAA